MRGGKDIVAAGGSVIAQDESHQRGVGHAGGCRQCRHLRRVLPLNQIRAETLIGCFREIVRDAAGL